MPIYVSGQELRDSLLRSLSTNRQEATVSCETSSSAPSPFNPIDLQRFVYDGNQMVASYTPDLYDGQAWTGATWEAAWGPWQDRLLTFVDNTWARTLNIMRDHRNMAVAFLDGADASPAELESYRPVNEHVSASEQRS